MRNPGPHPQRVLRRGHFTLGRFWMGWGKILTPIPERKVNPKTTLTIKLGDFDRDELRLALFGMITPMSKAPEGAS